MLDFPLWSTCVSCVVNNVAYHDRLSVASSRCLPADQLRYPQDYPFLCRLDGKPTELVSYHGCFLIYPHRLSSLERGLFVGVALTLCADWLELEWAWLLYDCIVRLVPRSNAARKKGLGAQKG